MADKLVDALGVPLAEHHRWLPDRVALWPVPPKIADKEAAGRWKVGAELESNSKCWWCNECEWKRGWDWGVSSERQIRLEVHHMARISHHDAPWNFALLCSTCHRHDGDAVKASSLYRLLTLKHKYDRQNCSWVHLALGMGRRLPTTEGEA